jgi:uncharacterized OB-fold protein
MALIQNVTRTTELTAWKGEIPVSWLYTAGRAGEKFFGHLKEKGELIGAECSTCQITYVPPRIYCEQCFDRLEDDYVSVPKSGTVYSFTLCMDDRSGAPLPEPQLIALIQPDGTDSLLVHKLGEVSPEEVFIGMPVEMVLEPKSKRKGSILDIRYFRPISG